MNELTEAEMAFFANGGDVSPELAEQLALTEPAPEVVAEPAATLIAESAAAPDTSAQTALDALTRALDAANANRQAAETRLQALEAQLAARANPAVEAPDPNKDPLGAMMHQLAQVNANVADLQNKQQSDQQNNLLKQQFEQFTSSVREIKNAYEKTVPDFQDAYAHIRSIRSADLLAAGVPQAQINQVILQDELNIAQTAIQRGKNPAEEMYNMAKRYGYATKAAPTAPATKIANIARGQEAAKQPQRAGAEHELTFEGLKDAGSSDLDALVKDDKLWAKLVGNRSNDIF